MPKSISGKEKLFVDHYLANGMNAVEAAIAAGYSKSTALAGAQNILNRPHIKKLLEIKAKRVSEKLELTTEEILKQLYFITTRDVRDFVDEDGVQLPISKLNERAAMCVDGFEQEVIEWVDLETGKPVRKIKNKLKLVSKASAIDMAMKYRGLFAPQQSELTVKGTLDFKALVEARNKEEGEDRVEKAMRELTEKAAKGLPQPPSQASTMPPKASILDEGEIIEGEIESSSEAILEAQRHTSKKGKK